MSTDIEPVDECRKCGQKDVDHSFVELLVCLLGGLETKEGHPFGLKDAELVRDGVVRRLSA